VVLTAGKYDIMSWLDNPGAWLTWRTAMLLSGIILEKCPVCLGNDECNGISVKLVALKSTILPKPCRRLNVTRVMN
jgi:hypothetical protein